MRQMAVTPMRESGGSTGQNGGSVSRHEPVMLEAVLELLNPPPGGFYVDGTINGAGHASAVAKRLGGGGTILGIDRDPAALSRASHRLDDWQGTVHLVQGDFRDLVPIVTGRGLPAPDMILLDLGLSSDQLDDPGRGFGYSNPDAPLDMRMGPDAPNTAAELLASLPEDRLRHIIRTYGEERWAARIARFICRERRRQPIRTAGQLVEVIKAAIPAAARRRGGHPARRTFQALRIAVNDELSQLEEAVEDLARFLVPGGRMAVLTFHSLEDRPVKRAFARLARSCRCPVDLPVCRCEGVPLVEDLTQGGLEAGDEEIARNRRARSARLRVVRRLANTGSGQERG